MKYDDLIKKLALFASILAGIATIAQASSSSSTQSSASSTDSDIQPTCLECPFPAKSHKHCGKGRILYLRDRTCYTCPKFKCVKKKYFKEGNGKVCPKILPSCNGRCKRNQTCLVTVQTRYSCSKAKCVKRLLNRNHLDDYLISKKK